jgi:hypothetical protein
MRLARPWQAPPDAGPEDEARTADGIYGLIVSAAVMATAHLPTAGRLAVAVLVTLVVYWAAERYATIVAGRLVAGRKRSRAALRRAEFAEGWGIVTTSFLPLVVLVAVDLLGADVWGAVIAALVCTTALLFLAGLRIGADGGFTVVQRVLSGCAAGAFGLVLIVLKVALH